MVCESVTAGGQLLAAPADPCSTVHLTPRWTLAKASDPMSGSTVAPGSTVTYQLTVTNISDAVVSNAVVTDDLADALAHGTLVAVPAGATLDGTVLHWTVPTLPAKGNQATLVYQIRIDADAQGVTIDNVATPGPGGSCTTCATDHATGSPPSEILPATGSDVGQTLSPGAFALALGGVLVIVARRRRTKGIQ